MVNGKVAAGPAPPAAPALHVTPRPPPPTALPPRAHAPPQLWRAGGLLRVQGRTHPPGEEPGCRLGQGQHPGRAGGRASWCLGRAGGGDSRARARHRVAARRVGGSPWGGEAAPLLTGPPPCLQVNCLMPGAINTPFIDTIVNTEASAGWGVRQRGRRGSAQAGSRLCPGGRGCAGLPACPGPPRPAASRPPCPPPLLNRAGQTALPAQPHPGR